MTIYFFSGSFMHAFQVAQGGERSSLNDHIQLPSYLIIFISCYCIIRMLKYSYADISSGQLLFLMYSGHFSPDAHEDSFISAVIVVLLKLLLVSVVLHWNNSSVIKNTNCRYCPQLFTTITKEFSTHPYGKGQFAYDPSIYSVLCKFLV